IIPAHNEEAVLRRTLDALCAGWSDGEFEAIVVANACSDRTAEIARGFGPRVRVLETDVPSKSNALNLGDRAARGFPRLYVDADVILSVGAVRRVAKVLAGKSILAAAATPRLDLSRSN